ncbi:hypothetical protein NDU88_002379 [Pleurodeles waltl]|uniref:Uncharacterized protein n=1 Tax=Pleurodeles waltl TaxID=8319 RepID=A0AAV7MMH3_PLEWA|nr:hypothetical protein NDU88_002379 [Pleurodeles waltl]
MVRAQSKREEAEGIESWFKYAKFDVQFPELWPEGQERLSLLIRNPGEVRCHSDLVTLQQEWTLRPSCRENLLSLLMAEEASDDRAGPPEVAE